MGRGGRVGSGGYEASRGGSHFLKSGGVRSSSMSIAPTYGEWMWRDLNGDGVVDAASEITANPSTGSLVGDGYWWVDDNAAIWLGPRGGLRP